MAARAARASEEATVAREFNVLALVKGSERYIFVYDDASRPELVEAFRAQAADPGLSFSWYDAAVMTQKAREQAAGCAPVGSHPRRELR
jgi:hypothetical protein